MIKALQEKTGARIQLPKAEENQAPLDDDDDSTIDVIVEGNALSAASARNEILKIAGERSANVNTKLRGIPAEFYPFISGPGNNFVSNLESNGVQVRVPPHQLWSTAATPRAPAPGQLPIFSSAPNDNHIQIAGDRAAVLAARAEIERRVAELRNQLMVEEHQIQRGTHQFIIGERGVPVDQFYAETGCVVVLPTDDEDETVIVIGPADQISAGSDKAMDLAMNVRCSNIDIARIHRDPRGGAAVHARNLTRYLRHREAISDLEGRYNFYINTPFSQDGALPWELYSRAGDDGKAAIRARTEITGIVNAHPPSRMGTVSVDPFFHQHLRKDIIPRVKETYGVHIVVPEASESDAPVLLVFEGQPTEEAAYQIPSGQPSQDDIRRFQKGLEDARKHILDLINKQEQITTATVDVPLK
jgi:hypothetical protein